MILNIEPILLKLIYNLEITLLLRVIYDIFYSNLTILHFIRISLLIIYKLLNFNKNTITHNIILTLNI